MLIPAWLSDALAAVMLTVAVYCASRLLLARLLHRHTNYAVDAVHTAMGVAMTGMLTARLTTNTPWVVLFAAATGWFGLRSVRSAVGVPGPGGAASHLRHVATSGAMLYMLAAPATASASPAPTMSSMSGMAGGSTHYPTLALLLVAFMVGYTVVVIDRLSRRAPIDADQVFAPRAVACCQVAMNITMGYLLLTLL